MFSTTGALRRGTVVVASLAATTAVALPGTPNAVAQGSSSPGATTPASTADTQSNAPIALNGVQPGTYEITLLTGDKVTLTGVDGKFAVTVRSVPRADGTSPMVLQESDAHGTYVLPSDALAAVEAGRIDRELFNVTYLAENGYADGQTANLPVIVQYPTGRATASVHTAAAALPASTPTHDLPSIHGAALSVPKGQTSRFWATVRGGAKGQSGSGQFTPSALGAGVAKVWLDRKAHVTLDQSVPLIGAPTAWADGDDGTGVTVGILDSGIDDTHPDLAGKVLDSRSFVDGVPTAKDDHGHGTHVASIITGSGAASGGRYKGVAPGVKLLIGKICNSAGQCTDSDMIAGMEWITAAGAKVVNMSVSGDPTDGTDPLSQAVDDLTASTGTLFVIAAGNNGVPESVGSPGTADAALTVAATDKSDHLANFSSRGPRLDGGLKPDIAAPGANIVAARADGTAMGPIVEDRYVSASGTSMATPHVVGAAAILVQEHPDWTPAQLKAALMSTAKDVGGTVYETGAGRVDVARFHTQQVFGATPNVDFGQIVGDATEPASKQVTYRNISTSDVTLTLKATLKDPSGTAADGALSLDATTLTVPANGTATASVTLDPTSLRLGSYSGAVTASADGVALTTPIGLDHQAPRFTLTVHTIGRDGQPVTPFAQSTIDVSGNRGRVNGTFMSDASTTVTRVPAGTISVAQFVSWIDEDSRANAAYLVNPEVAITGDTEITLDARPATQVTFTTPMPAEPLNNTFESHYQRNNTEGQPFTDGVIFPDQQSWGRIWASPTQQVSTGLFRFASHWALGQPEVTMNTVGPQGVTLHPVPSPHWRQTDAGTPDDNGHPDYRFFGNQKLSVADVGTGTPEDLAGRDLRGKLLLVEAGIAQVTFGSTCGIQTETLQTLRDTGAAGLLYFPSADSGCPIPLRAQQRPGKVLPLGIPYVSLSTREGLALREQVSHGAVTVQTTSTRETPYSYELKPYEEGRIPASLHYTFTKKQLAQVDIDVHAATPRRMWDYDIAFKQDDASPTSTELSLNDYAYMAPRSGRTAWIGPLDADVVHMRGVNSDVPMQTRTQTDVYDRPTHTRQQFFAGPITPGSLTFSDKVNAVPDPAAPTGDPLGTRYGIGQECTNCRQGNIFWPFFYMVDGGSATRHGDNMQDQWNFQLRLDKDGTPLAPLPDTFNHGYPVNDEPGTYHLTVSAPASDFNPQTDVTWTWAGGPIDDRNVDFGLTCPGAQLGVSPESCHPEPLVYVSYDMADSLAIDNTVAAGGRHTFTVDAYHAQTRAAMPKIAGLKLWASTDDGKTWVPVSLRKNRDGTFQATANYPRYDRTTGAVSLRAQAWDAAGNRVQVTTTRAVTLRDTKRPRQAQ